MKLVGTVCVALVAACAHQPPPNTNTCASGSGCGLVVPWSVNPQIPTTLSPGVTLESATFQIASLRVIGDAGPGDPRTTEQSFAIKWDQNGGEPGPVTFASAPSGLYSKVSLSVYDGAIITDSYMITGHASVTNNSFGPPGTYPFTIHDAFALSVYLDTYTQLDAGANAQVPINIDLAYCVGAVDWNLVHIDNGVLNLDTDDDWIPTFRQKLIQSFSIATDH